LTLFLIFFQPFTKFVEIGRVVYISQGVDAGKIAAIVDIIDQNRVSACELYKYFALYDEPPNER